MKFSLLILFVSFHFSVFSQSKVFEFQYQEMELDEAYIPSMTPHALGEPFTNMMQLLKEYYVFEETSIISGATTKYVQKSAIYYSTRKANKYLLKSLKKNLKSEEEVRSELERVLTVALNIRHQNTEELEDVLYKIKDPESIVEFYQKNIKFSD